MMFLLGILTMSSIATIGFALFERGKEDIGLALFGPICWATLSFCWMCRKLTHWIQFHNVRACLIDKDGCAWFVHTWAADAYRLVLEWEFPSANSKNNDSRSIATLLEKRANEWNKKNMGSFRGNLYPNFRYCPKSIWKNMGKRPKSEEKEILRKSKTE